MKNKEQNIKQVSEEQKNQNKFTPRVIPDEYFQSNGNVSEKKYSIFSTLDILNKNNDLFKNTKNTVLTAIKTIYSPEEIENLLKVSNCSTVEKFAKKVESVINGKNGKHEVEVTASEVSKFINKVKADKTEKDADENDLASSVSKRASGPYNLVNQVTAVYGTNRYLNNVELENLTMAPLFSEFKSEDEANQKIEEIKSHIKSKYGYSVSYSYKKNPINLLRKTLKPDRYVGKMDSCVGMLYACAKKLTGCENLKLKQAKKMINKKEYNEVLSNKKYEGESVKKLFDNQKDTIEDVVATLSTIFMARFVFDAKYFSQIEQDLAEQACAKMKNLRISEDINEDYWINQYIEDRLKVNISQILTANNITSAKQLLDVYNNNGTKIVNTKSVTCLEDLAFAIQYSQQTPIKNEQLENVSENALNVQKPLLKNSEDKVEKQKPNKYLDTVIRTSENYKKYYKEYLEKYNKLIEELSKIDIQSAADEISKEIDKTYEKLEKLVEKNDLNDENTDMITKLTARVDAIQDTIENAVELKNKKFRDANKIEELSEQEAESNSVPVGQLGLVGILEDSKEIEKKVEENNQENALTESNVSKNNDEENATEENTVENNEEENATEENKETENVDENAPTDEEQKLLDIYNDAIKQNSHSQVEIEDEEKNRVVFNTNKKLQDYNDEEVKKKIEKYYNKLVYGQNGKVGVIGENLNYRVINKSTKKSTFASDNERLDDKDLSRANKIRNEKAKEVVNLATEKTFKYYTDFKNVLKVSTIPSLCNASSRATLNIDDTEAFTKRDLKRFLSVLITKLANEELKQNNIEIYTGKKTYKKFKDVPCEELEVK